MEHFHYRNKCQIGHFFMNFHYERYENVKKSVPPKFKNEASDHLMLKVACPLIRGQRSDNPGDSGQDSSIFAQNSGDSDQGSTKQYQNFNKYGL